MTNNAAVRRSPSNNVQIIKISGLEGARGSLERQHRSVTKVTLRGEGGGAREPVTSVTTGTRNIGAKRRANSFAAVTTSTSVSLIRAPSIEKRLEDTERLEEVKARIVKILIDRESVAKENNELKRYIQCVEWLTGENRRLRQEIENIRRQDFTRSE